MTDDIVYSGQDRRNPDPTTLTTAALEREVSVLRNEFITGLASFEKITALQFELIADWRIEQKNDSIVRVDAALAAQKEAVVKQEVAIARQLDQLSSNFKSSFDEVNRSIADLKDRVRTIESVKTGMAESKQGFSDNMGLVYGAFGLILTIISIILVVGDVLTP